MKLHVCLIWTSNLYPKGSELRAQSTGRRAQGSEHRAQSTGLRAQGSKKRILLRRACSSKAGSYGWVIGLQLAIINEQLTISK